MRKPANAKNNNLALMTYQPHSLGLVFVCGACKLLFIAATWYEYVGLVMPFRE